MFQQTWQDQARRRELAGDAAIPSPPSVPSIDAIGLLVWEEHCVECAVPSCYSECPLYVRRPDGQCARFAYGIGSEESPNSPHGFVADILFRRWAKIEAFWPRSAGMVAPWRSRMLARIVDGLERAKAVSRRFGGSGETLRKTRKRLIRKRFAHGIDTIPDALYMVVYCDSETAIGLQLEIDRETDLAKDNRVTFRRAVPLQPGWNTITIPYGELPRGPGKIRLWPDQDRSVRLVFAALDLVRFAERPVPAPKVKCVAWDLDGTLWDGVIGDDGPENVHIRTEAAALIRQLDARGILQTIASKNDFDVAWPKIEDLGLAEVFLCPAIHWGRKSGSLRRIAESLNIGLDSFAFIDDSAFERAEVAAALPQVRVFDAADLDCILVNDAFDVPVTNESRNRRASYRAEANRVSIREGWDEDEDSFLRHCNMIMRIAPASEADPTRCLELLQRSNQFNLSGRRYTEQAFQDLLNDPAIEAVAFDVRDDFGDYGIVGFAAVRGGSTVIDFVMSCRVARKRVEETFFLWMADRARRAGHQVLTVCGRISLRNGPLWKAVAGLPLPVIEDHLEEDARYTTFNLRGGVVIPDVVSIRE